MIPLILAGIGLAASAISAAVAGGQAAEAQRLRRQAAEQFGDDILPQLDQLVARQLPEGSAEAYTQQTQATGAQSKALAELSRIVDFKGETPEDKAASLRAANAAGRTEASGRGAVLRHLAGRGLSGSGLEAALLNDNAQGAANNAYQAEVENAANSRGRLLQAIQALGGMGTSVRGSELQALSGRDSINRFNAQLGSDADRYNAGLKQQGFENEMALRTRRANAINGVASGEDRAADTTRGTGDAVGRGLITIADNYDQWGAKKKNPEDEWAPYPRKGGR